MEGRRRSILAVITVMYIVSVTVGYVSAQGIKYNVGGGNGWRDNFNYTIWSSKYHFYLGDFLYFSYAKGGFSVLEVNQSSYETCSASNPMVDWSKESGRVWVVLNRTGPRYFIDGRGYCWGGTKLSVLTEKQPPPASPPKSSNSTASSSSSIDPSFLFHGFTVIIAVFSYVLGF